MSDHGELQDKVKNTVAQLYVLRDSCRGKMHTENSSENLAWFQGAEAILKKAVDNLQKALPALGQVNSTAEKEEEDWADVERLIRKLDNSTVAQSQYS